MGRFGLGTVALLAFLLVGSPAEAHDRDRVKGERGTIRGEFWHRRELRRRQLNRALRREFHDDGLGAPETLEDRMRTIERVKAELQAEGMVPLPVEKKRARVWRPAEWEAEQIISPLPSVDLYDRPARDRPWLQEEDPLPAPRVEPKVRIRELVEKYVGDNPRVGVLPGQRPAAPREQIARWVEGDELEVVEPTPEETWSELETVSLVNRFRRRVATEREWHERGERNPGSLRALFRHRYVGQVAAKRAPRRAYRPVAPASPAPAAEVIASPEVAEAPEVAPVLPRVTRIQPTLVPPPSEVRAAAHARVAARTAEEQAALRLASRGPTRDERRRQREAARAERDARRERMLDAQFAFTGR